MHTNYYSLDNEQGKIDIYTFRVSRQNQTPNLLENYLLRVNPDETIQQYLIGYPYVITQNGVIYDQENVTVQLIEDDVLAVNKCLPVIVGTTFFRICDTPCTHIGPDGPAEHTDPSVCSCYGTSNGSSCDPPTDCHNEAVNIIGCSGLGGGSGNGSSDTSDPSTPIGGGGSSENNDNNTTPVIPNEPDVLLSQAVLDFIDSLSQNKKDWLNSLTDCDGVAIGASTCNQELFDEIAFFLNTNTENGVVSDEAEAFFDFVYKVLQNDPDINFEELLNFLNDSLIEFSDMEPNENTPELNAYSEIDNFFNNLSNQTFENESSELIDQQNNIRRDIHRVEISDFPEVSIIATINVKVPDLDENGAPDSFEVLTVDTELDGISSFFSWEQLDENDTNDIEGPSVTFNVLAQSVKIEIRGKLTVGFNYFDNLLQVTRVGHIVIYYNSNTGTLNENLSYWIPIEN